MKRKRIFDKEKVGALLVRFKKSNDTKVRDRIIELTLPLIDAAISRKRFYRNRDDLKQECVLKLLYALPKFDPERGNAFAFLWTTICNTCTTKDQKLSNRDLSLSSDENIQREAEHNGNGNSVFQTPENRHILNTIGQSLTDAFESVEITNRQRHIRACRSIKRFLITGELFYERHRLVKRLKRLGMDRREIQLYIDRTLILVRNQLLEARLNASAIEIRQVGPTVPQNFDT